MNFDYYNGDVVKSIMVSGDFTVSKESIEKFQDRLSAISNPFLNTTISSDNISDGIKRVIFNEPATIVLWKDGSKTVVKCCEGDTFDKEKGLMACIIKKFTGNTGRWNELIKEWTDA